MILLDKTLDEIMEETMIELQGMGISETDAGGVGRLFLAIINKRLSSYYDTLRTNMLQPFVSSATGIFLERIGRLVDCAKLDAEAEEDYRYRITKQIQNVASGNYTAIRLALLSIPGVQEVTLKRFTHGTGSFSAYIISEDPVTSQDILDQANAKIQQGVESFGVRGEAFRPIIVPVEMKMRLIFNKGVVDLDKKLAITQAEEALKNYINGRNVGESIVIDDIYKLINAVHDGIEEIIIFSFKVNNRPVLNVDQKCAWNERFVESDKTNSIQVMPL